MRIDENTSFVGSIASKQSSVGSNIHNAAYDFLGLNFIYLPFEVSNCREVVNGLRALNFRGFTVSFPFKQEVMKYLDAVDPTARVIGAVNTVLNDHGKLAGYNSDWIGAMATLKEVTALKNKKAVLLGGGGAARAIAYGLKKNGVKTTVYNRTKKHAEGLANTFGHQYGGGIADFQNGDYDILINATSVGFYADDSIVSEDALSERKIVMDIVFNKLETPLLRMAKTKHCTVIPGYRMLIHQALFQFKLFTGNEAPFDVMEETVRQKLRSV